MLPDGVANMCLELLKFECSRLGVAKGASLPPLPCKAVHSRGQ